MEAGLQLLAKLIARRVVQDRLFLKQMSKPIRASKKSANQNEMNNGGETNQADSNPKEATSRTGGRNGA